MNNNTQETDEEGELHMRIRCGVLLPSPSEGTYMRGRSGKEYKH